MRMATARLFGQTSFAILSLESVSAAHWAIMRCFGAPKIAETATRSRLIGRHASGSRPVEFGPESGGQFIYVRRCFRRMWHLTALHLSSSTLLIDATRPLRASTNVITLITTEPWRTSARWGTRTSLTPPPSPTRKTSSSPADLLFSAHLLGRLRWQKELQTSVLIQSVGLEPTLFRIGKLTFKPRDESLETNAITARPRLRNHMFCLVVSNI